MKFLAQEWMKAANDDLLVVDEIIDNALITNVSAFHCQQCVEKCFKAIFEENGLRVPKIHSLVTLNEELRGIAGFDFNEDILDKLDKLYIDARYPSELGLLPYGKPTKENAREFYSFTRDVYNTIKGFLESR